MGPIETIQFEGVKVALKQDKTGYVLALSMHPDDIPEPLLRDWVGARYQVVMVRLDSNEQPMDRQEQFQGDRYIKIAAMLCNEEMFAKYLVEKGLIFDADLLLAKDWLRSELGVYSRSELKHNREAQIKLDVILGEYKVWQQKI